MGDFRSGKREDGEEIWIRKVLFQTTGGLTQQIFNYGKIHIKLVMLPLGLHPDRYTIILVKAPERMRSNTDHSLFWVFSELPISISASVCKGAGITNSIWGVVICHEIVKLSFLIFS